MTQEKEIALTTRPAGTWVQTDRMAHEKWAALAVDNHRAAAVLHILISKMGRHNALVISQKTLAQLSKCGVRTISTAIAVLKEQQWIEVRQIGPTGTACAYIINDRVAWSGKRDGIRYSLFSAAVLVSDKEQPDKERIGAEPPLNSILTLGPGEQQLPTGPGLEPPSSPQIPGLETDLPARRSDDKQTDLEDFING